MKFAYSLRFTFIFCTLLSLNFGCVKSNSEKASKRKMKIGFVLATMNEERYQKDRDYFLSFAKERGVDVEFASCDDKVGVQTSKVETLLSKNIDVLVVQPVDGNTAAPIVRMAKRDKVPVVAYDRLIKNADLDVYVTQDSFKVGVLQAEAAVAATGGKGNFVLLLGESGHSVAEQITRGNLSVLEKQPNVRVIVKQNHPGWSTSLALATVENTLTRFKNKVDAILANNDGMALGAIQALDEQKLAGKVFVAGADADLAAVKDIVRGKQTLTVLKGIKPLAMAAVDAAIALAKSGEVKSEAKVFNGKKQVPVVNTPVFPVTKKNIQTQVIDYGFHTHQDVYGQGNT